LEDTGNATTSPTNQKETKEIVKEMRKLTKNYTQKMDKLNKRLEKATATAKKRRVA
jgi:DNA-binding ferritin-like protein (Dps family)